MKINKAACEKRCVPLITVLSRRLVYSDATENRGRSLPPIIEQESVENYESRKVTTCETRSKEPPLSKLEALFAQYLK